MGLGQPALDRAVSPRPEFWRGKRVFVTGHTGFKGAWLGAWLDLLGASVHGFALPPETNPNLSALIDGRHGGGTLADIRDAERVSAAMAGFAPDIVLHLAAQSLVRRSYREPAATVAVNVMGTLNVLEAIRATPSVRAAIIVTSDKCYQNQEGDRPYRESDALGGADPYSASKACAELVTAAWRRSFFAADQRVAIASARAGNVIGGGDWAEDRLIPDCIAALAAGRAIELRNPHATRPWQHVLDPLAGYLSLAERLYTEGGDWARAWNFGPPSGDIRPVSVVVAAVIAHWGEPGCWIAAPLPGPHEAGRLALDPGLARTRLGWAPRLALDDALAWTVDWYRRHRDGEAAASLVRRQIEAWEALPAGTP